MFENFLNDCCFSIIAGTSGKIQVSPSIFFGNFRSQDSNSVYHYIWIKEDISIFQIITAIIDLQPPTPYINKE